MLQLTGGAKEDQRDGEHNESRLSRAVHDASTHFIYHMHTATKRVVAVTWSVMLSEAGPREPDVNMSFPQLYA